MEILDPQGRQLEEVTARLSQAEVADLLVAASSLDDGSAPHALVRDGAGRTLAIYRDAGEASPLAKQTDWWLGPVVLLALVFFGTGVWTVARAIVRLIF